MDQVEQLLRVYFTCLICMEKEPSQPSTVHFKANCTQKLSIPSFILLKPNPFDHKTEGVC